FKSTTIREMLTFMKKESNTIIKEAQATTINGNQEYSLAFSFILINPPTYYLKKYFNIQT
ncbi:hypothetical protein, partial [Methanobrevibacter sp. UBA212]|uniref:hypothetical protein n=1 Tax=Methanobrevibacter sp. UBA212 TaxID=1915476 RepID=UPI0025CF8A9C